MPSPPWHSRTTRRCATRCARRCMRSARHSRCSSRGSFPAGSFRDTRWSCSIPRSATPRRNAAAPRSSRCSMRCWTIPTTGSKRCWSGRDCRISSRSNRTVLELSMNAEPKPLPDTDALWMPFTANRQFKAAPRLLVAASGMYYTTHDGRRVLDGTAGLWCVNAGHCRSEIADAVARQSRELDYAPGFQMGHPLAFEAASRVARIMPAGLERIFFTNSGSESVDTALKIALAYHRARGEPQRYRFIGRERGYHGVGFGGISVGGIANNRKTFGANLMPGIDHLPHTLNIAEAAFSRGQPTWGAHLAEELERLIVLHDASTIAGVIVEPLAASGGVLVPPRGYLERLREICTRHGLVLLFDEVITAFGRLGTATASEYL